MRETQRCIFNSEYKLPYKMLNSRLKGQIVPVLLLLALSVLARSSDDNPKSLKSFIETGDSRERHAEERSLIKEKVGQSWTEVDNGESDFARESKNNESEYKREGNKKENIEAIEGRENDLESQKSNESSINRDEENLSDGKLKISQSEILMKTPEKVISSKELTQKTQQKHSSYNILKNKLRKIAMTSFLSFGDDTKLPGYVTKVLYEGEWHSKDHPDQADFFHNTDSGHFLGVVHQSETNTNQFMVAFQINETHFLDSKSMVGSVAFDFTNLDESHFVGEAASTLNKLKSFFSSAKSQQCQIGVNTRLAKVAVDGKEEPVPARANDIKGVTFKGTVSSDDKECGLSFGFDSKVSGPQILKATIFTILECLMCVLSIIPLYRMLRGNNMMPLLLLNQWSFLGNIMIDLALVVINLSFAMRILIQYFEFLTVVTMFLMFCILFKIRFYLHSYELRSAQENFNARERTRQRFCFLFRFVIFCVIAVSLGNFLIPYEFLFIPMFLYPIFQIVHNIRHVTRKNCFKWNLHPLLMAPQVFYPIYFKGLPPALSFFGMTPYPYMYYTLLPLVFFFLFVMLLQRSFGAIFFLPKRCMPNYFEYFKKISDHPELEEEACPICFSPLNQSPESDENSAPLLMKKFMQTPCKHNFHPQCLQDWMEHKLVCPCCRESIPPIL